MDAPNPLPFPLRIAVGVAATAMDEARKLPEHLVGLPMTVASRMLQASMRAQQQVTELALRGDEVFAQLRPVDEEPPWARFDEDSDVDTDGPLATVLTGPGVEHPLADDEAPAEADDVSEADVARALTPATAQQPLAEVEPPLAGYDELTLPQLRGKLRALPLEQLEALVEYEQAHRDRPPFVTMLSNRINTVRSR